MHQRCTIHINRNLKYLLRAEATKHRHFSKTLLLQCHLIDAGKTLKIHPFKYNWLFQQTRRHPPDTYKITKISRNHINSLKIKVNKLINCINKQNPIKIPIIGIVSIPINPIIREFSPRYIYYGAFKIHKKKHLEPSYPIPTLWQNN